MSARREVLLWSSAGSGDGYNNLASHPASTDGGFYDSVECHGGENSGNAQQRLTPRTGKYANLPGLSWMNDLRCDSFHWSSVPNDTNRSHSENGGIVIHDHVRGGPWSRLEHVHVLDCDGYDYLTLHWQCKILNYEGLRIDAEAAWPDPTRIDFTDSFRIAAAGMPSIDSSEEMFTLPKLMRMHQDGVGRESTQTGGAFANSRFLTFTITAATTTFTNTTVAHGLLAGDIVTFSSITTTTGYTAGTRVFVRTAGLTATAFTISATGAGGAAVALTNDGSAVLGNVVRVATASGATDIFTVANGHGLAEGQPVQLWRERATGVLPVATGFSGHLTAGRTYYAKNVTPLTLQLAFVPGGTAIGIDDNGTAEFGILVNQKDPGTGPQGLVWRNHFNVTDLHWQPQEWINGGEMLWVKWRSSSYPGANNFLQYDQITPCSGFEGAGTENLLGNLQGGVGPMFKQYGRIYRVGNEQNFKFCGRGDRFEVVAHLGYPVHTRGPVTAATAADPVADNAIATSMKTGVEMRITGLARIGLIVGGTAADWNANTLDSDPVAPATSPRQHIRGRLKAILSTR